MPKSKKSPGTKVSITVRRILFVEATVTPSLARKLKRMLADVDIGHDARESDEIVELIREADPKAWELAESVSPIYEVREDH